LKEKDERKNAKGTDADIFEWLLSLLYVSFLEI
jgi:hypothetical protein